MLSDWTIGAGKEVAFLRRDLHSHPETGFLEYRTASLAATRLQELGYTVKVGPEVMTARDMMGIPSQSAIEEAQKRALAAGASPDWIARMPNGQTGVVAELKRGEGPVLAFRFDIDALPLPEVTAITHVPAREGFSSQYDRTMHACGHDGHTAIGLTIARRLADPALAWHGTIKLIFQPAEEGGRGAYSMVTAGILDDVDYLFIGHLGCLLPTGQVACAATGFLFSKKMNITFTGVAAHAAMGPQDGRNALLAGATAALGLHGLTRHASETTHVNVGRMTSGTARNIIADHCLLEAEVRGSSEEAIEYMERRAREVIAGAAAMQDVTYDIALMGAGIGIESSTEAAMIVRQVAASVPGINEVVPGWPIGGGDDAAYMMRRVQQLGRKAGYFIIGSDTTNVHHANDFDFDETSLSHGVQIFAGIAEKILARA